MCDDTVPPAIHAREDDRFREHPPVVGESGIRFYAGSPLVTLMVNRLAFNGRQDQPFSPEWLRAAAASASTAAPSAAESAGSAAMPLASSDLP